MYEELNFMSDKVMKMLVERECSEIEFAVKNLQRFLDMYYDYDLDKTQQSRISMVISDCEDLVERHKRITEAW